MTELPEAAISGDASLSLEEILGDAVVAPQADRLPTDTMRLVELVGPHLRIRGRMALGRFRRVTDLLNSHDGLLRIADARVLRRNGDETRVSLPDLWVSPGEVTIIAQLENDDYGERPPEFMIPKAPMGLIIVTPGHTITGEVYTPPEAQLSVFIESPDPAFIPMTDVRTRSLADRRVRSSYQFVALNRKHIVAASALPSTGPDVRKIL